MIERFNAKGRPIAHVIKNPGQSPIQVELPFGVPGDHFLVTLGKTRRGKARAYDLSLEIPSPDRIKPLCVHAETCGGCPWQALTYAAQITLKQQYVEKLFALYIKQGTVLRPMIPCASPWHYRNKMEFTFSQNLARERFLGLMKRAGRGHVLNLSECHIGSSWMVRALDVTHAWWQKTSLAAYHPHRDTGSLRTLTVREGKRTEAKMAILTVSGRPEFAISKNDLNAWVQTMNESFPGISCFLRVHQACKGIPTQFYEWHLSGSEHLEEKMLIDLNDRRVELRLQISPSSFFQTNTHQAEKVYSEALKILDLSKVEHLIDLYAGTATIGMALAQQACQVTAIELNPYAILDAEANISANEITNLELIQGDAAEALSSLSMRPGFIPPEALIVDPPRSGLGPKALEPILSLKPPKLLYISCNPTTQATDIDELVKSGYNLVLLQPIDQFPHTHHVENIALLSLR